MSPTSASRVTVDRAPRQASGQTLVLFALFAPVVLAFVALGLDAAQVFLERRDAQGAADLASLAGARDLPGDPVAARSSAVSIGVANGYRAGEVVPVTPYGGDPRRIEVTVSTNVATFFMPILDFFLPGDHTTIAVSARAVAAYEEATGGGGDHALFSLQPCGSKEDFTSINWSGNINAITGSVHSSAGTTVSGNGQTITGDFSLECTAKGSGSTAITDKFPYNETGDNPALTDGGGPGGLTPAACTGSEPVGRICRQDLAPPTIPSWTTLLTSCTYTRTSDTDFASQAGAWTAPGGDLYAGVYCVPDHKLSLSTADIAVVPRDGRVGITLLAKEIVITGNRADLKAHLDGILMYANTTEEGKGVDYAANEGRFEGIIWSPRASSKVKWAGNQNILRGALVGYRVEYSGERNQLIGTFDPFPATEATLALIE